LVSDINSLNGVISTEEGLFYAQKNTQ